MLLDPSEVAPSCREHVGALLPAEAAIVAATRISGICFGVLCSVVLSVIIFPKSANCEAVDSMAHALLDLSALHALAWTGGRSEALPGQRSAHLRRSLSHTDNHRLACLWLETITACACVVMGLVTACGYACTGRDGSASPMKRKRKKTDAYVHIGTTEEYAGGMSDKDRRELECEKVP